jgi:MFS family permease
MTLILGSSLESVGIGAFLPYLYTDIATTRHLGGAVAAMTFTVFAAGSLLAAPIAGRLADGRRPVLVASASQLAMAAGLLGLGFAQSALMIWAIAGLTGMALALTQPAIGVLLLAWTPEHRIRQTFAWQFIGANLAVAAGGFTAGLIVDLSSVSGTRPIYLLGAAASVGSAAVVTLAGLGAMRRTELDAAARDAGEPGLGVLDLLRVRPVRWLLGIVVLLMLACYSQYDSGLPAYALGTGVAVNAILVSALTVPVVALTNKHQPTTLLAWCGALWIGCWLIFGAPLLLGAGLGVGTGTVVVGYAAISFGETMLAPVLTPFAATLAPEGAIGRTLGAVTGATTLANAVGPMLSGVLLALGVPVAFIALQLGCCAAAVAAAIKLGRIIGVQPRAADVRGWDLDVADELVFAV